MKAVKYVGICLLVCSLFVAWKPIGGLPQQNSQTSTVRDGQHDFDFNVGTWRTHIRRLQSAATGSPGWIELNGTVVVRKVWHGRAQLEEVEADGPNGHFEDLALFLYNPQSHQWNQTFANSKLGTLSVPMYGEFKDGRGEFFDQEQFNGRTVLFQAVWSEIKPNSHRFEQAVSEDGGRTWKTNFIATLTREKT